MVSCNTGSSRPCTAPHASRAGESLPNKLWLSRGEKTRGIVGNPVIHQMGKRMGIAFIVVTLVCSVRYPFRSREGGTSQTNTFQILSRLSNKARVQFRSAPVLYKWGTCTAHRQKTRKRSSHGITRSPARRSSEVLANHHELAGRAYSSST